MADAFGFQLIKEKEKVEIHGKSHSLFSFTRRFNVFLKGAMEIPKKEHGLMRGKILIFVSLSAYFICQLEFGRFTVPNVAAESNISWDSAKKNANAFIEEYKIFRDSKFYLEPDIYGETWKKTVLEPGLKDSPEQQSKLLGKSYHVFHYVEKTDRQILDGDFWIFVDDETGKILTVMKYLLPYKTGPD